jgi:hypothetical protein
MKTLRKRTKALMLAALAASAFLLTSCNPIENDSESASLLVVQRMTGVDLEGREVSALLSDVALVDPETGATSVYADFAKATLSVQTLDPAPIMGMSQYNDVQLTRYVVTFSRSDGRNVQGKDVPYSFEANLTETIKVGMTSTVTFILVREAAKLETPLLTLRDAQPDNVLNVTAKVEFYGHDLAERKVKGTGYLSVHFANYVDK